MKRLRIAEELTYLRMIKKPADGSKSGFDIPARVKSSLTFYPGGSLLKFKSRSPMPSIKPPRRGQISEFSEPSRRRFLELLATLKRDGQPVFVTLTYPNAFPTYHEDFKRHLELFWHRLSRRWPGASTLWKLEFQTRKSGENEGKVAPHYHLIIYGVPNRFAYQEENRSWYSVNVTKFPFNTVWTEWARGDRRICQE